MAKKSTFTPAAASPDDVKNLLSGSLDELKGAIRDHDQKLFPNGIELVDIQVKVMNIEVTLKAAGPKAGSLLEGAPLEGTRTL